MNKREIFLELAKVWFNLNDLKVGDIVKVTRRATTEEDNITLATSSCSWNTDRMIVDSVLTVKSLNISGGTVNCTSYIGTYCYPYTCLEKIETKKELKTYIEKSDVEFRDVEIEVIVTKENVTFNDYEYSHDTIKEMSKIMRHLNRIDANTLICVNSLLVSSEDVDRIIECIEELDS